MITGRHLVRDANCKKCKLRLGWKYEFAFEETEKYKVGMVILEQELIRETEGFDKET